MSRTATWRGRPRPSHPPYARATSHYRHQRAHAPGPRRAAAAMARVVATRARGAEPPPALAFVDDDALVPGGPASAAGRHAAGGPVDMSFFEDDDATLLAELLDERSPSAAARPAAAPNCLNQAHRRGCTECVAALRRSGQSASMCRPIAQQKRVAPACLACHLTCGNLRRCRRCTLAPSPEEAHLYKLSGDAGRCAAPRAAAVGATPTRPSPQHIRAAG